MSRRLDPVNGLFLLVLFIIAMIIVLALWHII